MDPIRAVTSGLKLVNKSLKAASTLQEFSEIQDDYMHLKEQVTSIDAIIREFQKVPSLFPSNQALPHLSEPLLVHQAVNKLKEIHKELDEIVTNCTQTSNSERASKHKWIPQRNKITKLTNKATDAKSNLQTALNLQVVGLAIVHTEREDQFHSEVLDMIRYWRQLQSRPLVMAASGPTNDAGSSRVEEFESDEDDVDKITQRGEDGSDNTTTFLSDYSNDSTTVFSETEVHSTPNPERKIHVFGARLQEYIGRCQCQCHMKQSNYQTPKFLQPILGSLTIAYTPKPRVTKSQCTGSKCQCLPQGVIRAEYAVPRWLWARNLLLKIAYGNSGLELALRPSRMLHSSIDNVWWWVAQSGKSRPYIGNVILPYFPDDQNEMGESLIETSIVHNNFEAMELFLLQWQSLLPKQGLSRRAGVLAARALESKGWLDDRKKHVLHQVLKWTDERPEWKWTSLHEAAKHGFGMQAALRRDAWTMNEAGDAIGSPPLHVAIKWNNVEAAKELIAAGADINRANFEVHTPLMIAAGFGRVECMRLILQAGCNVDQKDPWGDTAIHIAVRACQPEVVSLLLAAGASPSCRGCGGRTPLHQVKILNNIKPDLDAFGKILDLLLVAKGAEIEVKDDTGFTPVMLAMAFNNVTALCYLLRAGASLSFLHSFSENMLHMAAKYSNLEMLEYLLSVSPDAFLGINADLCNEGGETPWSIFLRLLRRRSIDVISLRRPSEGEREAFTRLYQTVRDQNIQRDIQILESAATALRRKDFETAGSQLDAIVSQKQDWKQHELAGFYRGIRQQIQENNYEEMIYALIEEVEYLKSQVGILPWELGSLCTEEPQVKDGDEWETCSSSDESGTD